MTLKPNTASVLLLLGWFVLAVVVAFIPSLLLVWQGATFILAVILGLDALWLWQLAKPEQFSLCRQVNKNLPMNNWSEVSLSLNQHSRWQLQLNVYDHYPQTALVSGLPQSLSLPKQTRAVLSYKIKPLQRGDSQFTGVDLMVHSPLKLWRKRVFITQLTQVRVYPNFGEVAKYSLLATDNRLSQLGIRRRQRRGEGQDFRQLREYRLGDAIKQIDWKATSRYNKLISREYQDERDQQIVFLLDCSRRMRHMEAGQAHLDQALNAMLLLSFIAVRQGDATGFLSYGGMDKWAAPQKGGHVVNYLLTQSYDLSATMQAADYVAAAQKLLTMQRKRSLVILITNTRDEDQTDLTQAIKLLAKKHLVVLADLYETSLQRVLEQPATDIDTALTYHSTLDYLQRRQQTHEKLSHAGAICVDTTAPKLPIRLVNQYLDIKQAGRL